MTAHIYARLPSLVSAHLHADPLNYTFSTRPAYSSILPFPTPYLLPPRIHDAALKRSSPLNLTFTSSPEDLPPAAQTARHSSDPSAQAQAQAEGALGRNTRSLLFASRRQKLSEALEETALRERFRVEGAVDGICAPLDALLEDSGSDVEGSGFLLGREGLTSVDCLAYGYMSLLLYPDVPRKWCAEIIRARWKRVARYVDKLHAKVLPALHGTFDAKEIMSRASLHDSTLHHQPRPAPESALPYTLAPPPSPLRRALTLLTSLFRASISSSTQKSLANLVRPSTYRAITPTPLAALGSGLLSATGLLAALATVAYAGAHVVPRLLPDTLRGTGFGMRKKGVVHVLDGMDEVTGLDRLWRWSKTTLGSSPRATGRTDAGKAHGSAAMSDEDIGSGLASLGRSMAGNLSGVDDFLRPVRAMETVKRDTPVAEVEVEVMDKS